ncbi:9602_t:CDS:1, partial [Racocetra persica]
IDAGFHKYITNMHKRPPGIEFKYKAKKYFFNFLYLNEKGPEKIRPLDEPDNKNAEITVKDYKAGK